MDNLDEPWVIRYAGAFYRANRAGYTTNVIAAGLYTMREAKQEEHERQGAKAYRLADYLNDLLLVRHLVDNQLERLAFIVQRLPLPPKDWRI